MSCARRPRHRRVLPPTSASSPRLPQPASNRLRRPKQSAASATAASVCESETSAASRNRRRSLATSASSADFRNVHPAPSLNRLVGDRRIASSGTYPANRLPALAASGFGLGLRFLRLRCSAFRLFGLFRSGWSSASGGLLKPPVRRLGRPRYRRPRRSAPAALRRPERGGGRRGLLLRCGAGACRPLVFARADGSRRPVSIIRASTRRFGSRLGDACANIVVSGVGVRHRNTDPRREVPESIRRSPSSFGERVRRKPSSVQRRCHRTTVKDLVRVTHGSQSLWLDRTRSVFYLFVHCPVPK